MKHITHLVLVFVIAAVLVTASALILKALVPDSYGEIGDYTFRTDSLKEEANEEIVYPDNALCMNAACHGEDAEEDFLVVMGGGHKQISCQACHGLLDRKHIETKGKEEKPMIIPAYYDFIYEKTDTFPAQEFNIHCLNCHQKKPGKPDSFPQLVDFESHKSSSGGTTETSCYDCHDHHSCQTF